jgi:aspartate/methionine/tyrosine aminotransferase
MDRLRDITQHEVEALKHDYNMSDAHTHQSQSPTQRNIVQRLPELWYGAEQSRQYDLEQRFLETFFRVQGRPAAMKNNNAMIVYAASIAMAITANYVHKKRMKVSLIHPCFDNLVDLMKHIEVPLEPVEESWLYDPSQIYDNLKANVTGDAIFLVDPNNPTGFTLYQQGKAGWLELIRFAKENDKLLIFDFCFAAFMLGEKRIELFDIYEMLESSGVSYIAMEDTGKTWPLQDAKAAILKTSRDIYDDVYDIYTAYLLNVSPFILNVVTEYILDSERDSFASVHGLLLRNRAIAEGILSDSILEPMQPEVNVSVMWCKIKDPEIKASELKAYLTQFGIHVLAGTYFYWAEPERGERYIRIALARNTQLFEPAMRSLCKAIEQYEKPSPLDWAIRNLRSADNTLLQKSA